MAKTRYLIVGGGMAADAAARGIRERDKDGAITLVGADPHAPYARPPLSKGLWKGDAPDTVWKKTEEVGIDLKLGRRITRLDLARHVAVDDQGAAHAFDRALLATGGQPRRLPFGGPDVIYFRTLDDFRRLRAAVTQGTRVAVIGGGFIGSEVAASLAMNGAKVSMIFPEEHGIGAKAYGPELAGAITKIFRDHGVEVIAGDLPAAIDHPSGHHVVRTKGGREVKADVVVAGLGIEPDVTLAREAGLTCHDGIEVDARLRTSAPDVFAAGDVASVVSPVFKTRVRVEHEDSAVTMGGAAGRSMAGDETPYTHVPFFYSDLFDLGYEAVGRLDARLAQVSDWKTPFREGVVYYIEHDRVVGVLLLGIFGKVDEARALLAETGPIRADDLKGRIGG